MPLHPVVVHLPMALAVLIPLLALAVLVAWRRAWLPAKAWALVLGLQAVLALSAVAALNTGERDEDRVEKVVSEAAIEAHEDAAKLFTVAGFAVLALGALPLVLRRDTLRQAFAAATVAGTLGVAGLGYNVGHKGGRLVYAEGAASAFSTTVGVTNKSESKHDDDD